MAFEMEMEACILWSRSADGLSFSFSEHLCRKSLETYWALSQMIRIRLCNGMDGMMASAWRLWRSGWDILTLIAASEKKTIWEMGKKEQRTKFRTVSYLPN